MSATAAAIAKAAAVILSDERGRKAVGWILVAALSPLILIIAVLCSLGSGGAEHNNTAVKACFYGSAFTEQVPAEYQSYVTEMRSAFSLLDSAVASVNAQAEDGSLDAIRVKAVFYALCFGEDAPSRRAANNFVGCFYTTETRTRTVEVEDEESGETTTEEEEYTVTVPLPLSTAYANVASALGREISDNVWGLFVTAVQLDDAASRKALLDLAHELELTQNLLDWIEKTEEEKNDRMPPEEPAQTAAALT